MLLGRGTSQIEIIQRADTQEAKVDAGGQRAAINTFGVFKVGLVVDDLQALHDRLVAAGAEFNHHIVQPEGNPLRTFAVRDPEGNIVQIFGR